jgi:hypothetical protein
MNDDYKFKWVSKKQEHELYKKQIQELVKAEKAIDNARFKIWRHKTAN